MVETFFVLVLIYSPFQMEIEQFPSKEQCIAATHGRIGEAMKVVAWDNMAGSNPIPRVIAAFCADGQAGPPS